MNNTELIALYARCSTDKQDLIAQKQQLYDYIEYYKKDNNIEAVDYFDEGYSGTNQRRPALKQLIDDIKKGKVNKVVITKLDRLARTVNDLLELTRMFKSYNVDLLVIKDNFDTSTPQGKMMFQLIAVFNEFERNTIVQRM